MTIANRAGSRLLFLLLCGFTLLLAGCPSSSQATRCGPPTVNAGEDLQGKVGEMVILQASLRLPPESEQLCIDEKASVTFRWEQLGGPDVELQGANQPQASFVPGEPGSYSFRCQATYPVTAANPAAQVSQWDTVQVEVQASACPSPLADAGEDQQLATLAGQPVTVTLDGSSSRPAEGAGCQDVQLTSSTWTQVSGPTVSITNADQLQATVELSEFGDYVFQLEVRDSGGTEGGRVDTASDTVAVSLVERSPCEENLVVTVVEADGQQPLAGIHVTVVDAAGQSHNQDTDASGQASFTSLAVGTRKSITAISDEKVTALPGASGERNKYEITTVLEHCSSTITIPLRLTESGWLAQPRGLVTGKVPQNIWDMLPHSFRCAGSCASDSDCDAIYSKGTYYCEQEANTCQGSCTPRSLLPFFSLGGGEISGQMRVVIITDTFDLRSISRFPVRRLFARPPTADAILPGNLTSDDTFLNGLAPSLGLDPYGDICDSSSDCPDTINWMCDTDQGGYCKDLHPLRNVRMEVPAGTGRTLVLLAGVMNISMIELLPVLLPFLDSNGEGVSFDVASMMAAFKVQTLLVCPLTLDIQAGAETSITPVLEGITAEDCFTVDYQQRDDVVPLVDPNAIDPANSCDPQNDNCSDIRPDLKCLADPDSPQDYYCMIPLYKVSIITNDKVQLQSDLTGFDPSDPAADERLCSQLPSTAQHEVKCDDDGNGIPETCVDANHDPAPIFCDVSVDPSSTDCSYPFGLSLAAIDVPPGHNLLPGGGRLPIGFDFNRTPHSYNQQPVFLAPPREGALAGTNLSVVQLLFRNLVTHDDMSYFLLPGHFGASASSSGAVASLALPPFLGPPAADTAAEAGFEVAVHFVPDDPLADCDTVTFEKVYALAKKMHPPQAGQNPPQPLAEQSQQDAALHGLLLSFVDRPAPGDKVDLLMDPAWRVYAPPGVSQFELPQSPWPFSSGQEILLTFWAGAFGSDLDYDLFPPQRILTGETAESEDGWFLQVP